ncbi:MAG: cobalamin-dependent protein [Candidatus Lokiarchaeota archaeon]|nr:cobalamin-dependent protein [Candidatus Lokiarchaeota archaeon]
MVQKRHYDLVLVHPPRNFQHVDRNARKRSGFLMMPMGLIGLADLVDREGFSPRIINYTLERSLNKKYSLSSHLSSMEFDVLGVDLHWIVHSAGAIDLLRLVKKKFPSTFTLLGGFSATYYAKEIITEYDFIDGIIQGDGEAPLVQLLKNVKKGRDGLSKVPNLIFRNEGRIVDNEITYVTQELDSLNFAKLNHVDHWREYVAICDRIMRFPFAVEMARGCPYNCIFCAGSRTSLKHICKRDRVLFRSPRRVVDDMKELVDTAGINGVFYGHGVYPATEGYFMEISKHVREEGLEMHADLEVWRLPISNKFMQDFSRTYEKDRSILWFSNRCFSSKYRQKLDSLVGGIDTAFSFTDAEFMHFIDQAKLHDVIVELFWDTGYPFETVLDSLRNLLKAWKVTMNIIKRKDKVALWSEPIFVSPGSLVDRFSEDFGVKVKVKTFKDHVALNRVTPMRLPPFDTRADYTTSVMPEIVARTMNRLMLPINFVSFFPAFIALASNKKMKTSRPGLKHPETQQDPTLRDKAGN